MTFEFAKATDITDFAKTRFPEMYDIYEKVFITPDTNDYHILRVLKGFDEEYDPNEDKVLLEHQMIPKSKTDEIHTLEKLKNILEEDDGGNYDYVVRDTVKECIKIVDGGYGLN